MKSFKKVVLGFGLVSVVVLQGVGAGELKECGSDEDRETGCVEIGYFSNGDTEFETPYKNGRIEGIAKEYYESGKLYKETPYKNGWIEGVAKEYYENGKLKAEASYGGSIVSKKTYYENGTILLAEEVYKLYKNHDGGYDSNRMSAKYYHKNGKLKEEADFDEGPRSGDRKFYTNDGKLLGTARYNRNDLQFVKCAEKKLSNDEAESLSYSLNHEYEYREYEDAYPLFEKYCK